MTTVTLLGVPWDGSSSFQRGAALAPPHIRAALSSPSSNLWNERGDDLAADGVLADAGDLALPTMRASGTRRDRGGVSATVIAAGRRPLILGGDHSITYPILRASFGEPRPSRCRCSTSTRTRTSTISSRAIASRTRAPSRGSWRRSWPARLIQAGVRTLNAHQRSQAAKFGVEILGADRWRDVLPLLGRLRGALYVSLDLDVLEPMLAPGVSHPEPGGLTVRDVLEVLAAIRVPVVGADIVEYNPANDVRDLTARVAAKFVKELAGVLRR